MITARVAVPTQAGPFVLSVFPMRLGARCSYNLDRDIAKFVRTVVDMQNDPMVTSELTTQEIYRLYPKLRNLARKVLWLTPTKPNWSVEVPLAAIGCTIYRDSPKSKTLSINIGKRVVRF